MGGRVTCEVVVEGHGVRVMTEAGTVVGTTTVT